MKRNCFETVLKNLGKYLVEYRQRHNLTQLDVASRLEISLTTYRRYEINPAESLRGMAFENLEKFASLECMDLSSFLALLEGKPSVQVAGISEARRAFVQEMQSVNDDEVASVVQALGCPEEDTDLIAHKMRWLISVSVPLLRLSSEAKARMEQQILDLYLKQRGGGDVKCPEYQKQKARLRTLIHKIYLA